MSLHRSELPVTTRTLTEYQFSTPLSEPLRALLPSWRLRLDGTYLVPSDPALDPVRRLCLSMRRAADREVALIFADMGDLPDDRSWLYRLRAPLTALLVGTLPSETATITTAITRLFDALRAQGLSVPRQTQRPPTVENVWGYDFVRPLFAFLATAPWPTGDQEATISADALRPAYCILGPALAVAYRKAEGRMRGLDGALMPSDEEALYRLGLCSRLGIRHGEVRAEDAEQLNLGAFLATFLASYTAAQKGPLAEEAEYSEQAERHAERLAKALAGILGHPEPRGPQQRHAGASAEEPTAADDPLEVPPEPVDELLREREPRRWAAGAPRRVAVTRGWSRAAEQVGECPGDYRQEHLEGPPGMNPAALRMARLRQEQHVPRDAIIFPFGREFYQPHEVAAIYRLLFRTPLSAMPPMEAATVVIVFGLLHTGIVPEEWCRLAIPAAVWRRIRRLSPEQRRPAVEEFILGGWPDQVAWPLGYRRRESVPWLDLARPVTDTITVVLAPALGEFLVEVVLLRLAGGAVSLPEENMVRVFVADGPPERPLRVEDVIGVLRSWGVSRPMAFIDKARRTFVGTYVGRLGLDELDAAYVSRQLTRDAATPRFYRYVPAKPWCARYLKTAVQAHALYSEALGPDRFQLPGLPAGELITPPLLTGGYGSCVVPLEGMLGKFCDMVEGILDRLARSADMGSQIGRHNVFTAYALIYFELATATRPIRDGSFGDPLAQADGARMLLQDKDSTYRCELRTQAVLPGLRQLRQELLDARAAALRLESFDGRRFRELGEPLIFFLTPGGRPSTATSTWVHAVLRAHPELIASFPFPLNVGRHGILTALSEMLGLDPTVARYGAGHTRHHTEELGRFSLTHIADHERSFAEGARAWLHRCGMRVLFSPKGG